MGFFERNRRQLADRGIDPDRLPPGQYFTERFPVLHVGDVPQIDVATWTLRVFGLVDRELTISWDELRAMPPTSLHTDIHCVTKWSKFDTSWTGVAVRDLFDRAGLRPEATHVMGHAAYGYTANLPLADVVRPESMRRVRVRRRADPRRARWPGAPRRAAPLLLEVAEVAARASRCAPVTSPASGSATGTTCTATRGGSSATGGD